MKFLHHKNGVTSAYYTSSDWWAIYGYRTDHMTNFTLTAKKKSLMYVDARQRRNNNIYITC